MSNARGSAQMGTTQKVWAKLPLAHQSFSPSPPQLQLLNSTPPPLPPPNPKSPSRFIRFLQILAIIKRMPPSLTQSVQCERPTAAQHPLVSPVLASWPNWKNQWQPFAIPTLSSSPSSSNDDVSSSNSSNGSIQKQKKKNNAEAGNPPGHPTTASHRHQSKQSRKHAGSGGSAPLAPAVAAADKAGESVGGKDDYKRAAKGDVRASKSSTPIRILFHQKTSSYNEFTNFANYEIVYEGRVYPTSEHLFQAFKVSNLFADDHHNDVLGLSFSIIATPFQNSHLWPITNQFMKARPDIAEYIRTSSSRPSQAASLGRAYQAFLRSDWSQIQVAKMDEILELKFTQHLELMQLLLGTGDGELVL
ncbi:hypothetical protein FRC17_007957, partial [Serendipita sp. 399]